MTILIVTARLQPHRLRFLGSSPAAAVADGKHRPPLGPGDTSAGLSPQDDVLINRTAALAYDAVDLGA
jgi:hypothetical protein